MARSITILDVRSELSNKMLAGAIEEMLRESHISFEGCIAIEFYELIEEDPTAVALDIPSVKSAHFFMAGDHLAGTVYDGEVGVEFDVRHDVDTWIVSDDEGRIFANPSLREALVSAIDACAPARYEGQSKKV